MEPRDSLFSVCLDVDGPSTISTPSDELSPELLTSLRRFFGLEGLSSASPAKR